MEYIGTKSTRKSKSDLKLNGNHKEMDTRLILNAFRAVDVVYQQIFCDVMCRDIDVILLICISPPMKQVNSG